MRSAFGDTFSSVSHVGLWVIKCTPDVFLASYAVLALLNLVAELELPGLAAWMEDTICCLSRPRDLQLTPQGKCLTLASESETRLQGDAHLSALPQSAGYSLPALSVREDSQKGELACE